MVSHAALHFPVWILCPSLQPPAANQDLRDAGDAAGVLSQQNSVLSVSVTGLLGGCIPVSKWVVTIWDTVPVP